MPLYDFQCTKCEHKFDDFLTSYKKPNSKCPKCGGETERLVSMFSCNVVGSPHKSLDSVIGANAEKRWEYVHKRRDKRVKEKQNVIVNKSVK